MTTLRSLAEGWKNGEYVDGEVAALASALTPPTRQEDPDGTIWWEGEEDNHPNAVYGLVGSLFTEEEAQRFLNLVTR